ncbi:hypothetical protein RP20_CCG023423 [Aedes albopictus]|nr:hypothetical protein RP20_CCG023423 [Aedes albopictus]
MFRSAMQKCLDVGVFPEAWKRQSLVLLPKAGKPPGDPSAYKPICLTDTAGKVLEKIIFNRMLRFTEGENGLSSNQYGFRKGRSTVNAILSVTKTAEKALEHKRRGIRFCAVVTLDVRNAFNSASWSAIADALLYTGVPVQDSRKSLPESSTSLRHGGWSEVLSHNLRSPARFHTGSGIMECHIRRGVEVRVPSGSGDCRICRRHYARSLR